MPWNKFSRAVLVLVAILALGFGFVWVGCTKESQPVVAPSATQQTGVLTKAAQFQRVIEIQNRHTDRLMENPDVVGTGTGADEKGNPVVLILTRREGVPNLPRSIDGVPVRVDVVGEVRALKSYTGVYRPVPGGVSVGNTNECAAGTIGCVVIKGGKRFALSNNHVFARENKASIGEDIVQPGRYDTKPKCASSEKVADLSDFKPIDFSTSASNEIDAAIAELTTTSVCSMVDNLYTPSSTVVDPRVGLAVKKVGRTSGLTTGTIAGINVTINVGYSSGTARFVNQIYVASSFIRSGDSGSLMVTQSGNNPVGLNFAGGAGTSFANPIGPVLSYFSATICSN